MGALSCGGKRVHQNAVRAAGHDSLWVAGEDCVGAVVGLQILQVLGEVGMQAEAQAEPWVRVSICWRLFVHALCRAHEIEVAEPVRLRRRPITMLSTSSNLCRYAERLVTMIDPAVHGPSGDRAPHHQVHLGQVYSEKGAGH